MTPILKRETGEGFAGTRGGSKASAKVTPEVKSDKPVFSLSSLKITKPRTATDIQRAMAQGRVAELKSD